MRRKNAIALMLFSISMLPGSVLVYYFGPEFVFLVAGLIVG